jgi:long-chain fatty acid transport protein
MVRYKELNSSYLFHKHRKSGGDMRNKQHLAWGTALLLAIPGVSTATNGYFTHGYGTASKALAGGGIALPQDSLAAATNPAGMVWLGERMDLGAALFSPNRDYTGGNTFAPLPGAMAGMTFPIMAGNHDSDNKLFLIPSFGWNTMLDQSSSMGVSVYANGGMNTEYANDPYGWSPARGVFADGTTGVDLKQLFVNMSYARKISDRASWGASLILAAQAFEAKGLQNFSGFTHSFRTTGLAATNLSDNGHDMSYGAGLKFGIQGEVADGLTLAASYQTKTWMTEFDDYKDLFADDGDFDIPATATIGLAWKPNQRHALTFDIQRIWYSGVDAVSNPMGNLFSCGAGAAAENCLGGDNGAGFGWDDMTVYKLGWQYEPNNLWTVRLGYSHTNHPINDDDIVFNILAPAVMEDHFTFGLTRKIGKNQAINFAAMYAPKVSLDGTNPFTVGQDVEIEMHQYELELSYTWQF